MTFGRDARHAEIVDRRADRAGDVRAVRVLVHVGRVGARVVGLVRARAVDQRDVRREVAAQRLREVRCDVRMVAVDAGVDDPDEDVLAAPLLGVGAVSRRVHHLHVPLQRRERLDAVTSPAHLVSRALSIAPFSGLSQVPHHLHREPRLRVGGFSNRLVSCDTLDRGRGDRRAEEVRVGRHDRRDADPRVGAEDSPPAALIAAWPPPARRSSRRGRRSAVCAPVVASGVATASVEPEQAATHTPRKINLLIVPLSFPAGLEPGRDDSPAFPFRRCSKRAGGRRAATRRASRRGHSEGEPARWRRFGPTSSAVWPRTTPSPPTKKTRSPAAARRSCAARSRGSQAGDPRLSARGSSPRLSGLTLERAMFSLVPV